MGVSRADIQYPFAVGADGALVEIEQYKKGTSATCVGCEHPMVGRQGGQVRWHFAHASAAAAAACSNETALHLVAKRLIVDGFTAAKRAGRPYTFTWPCSCGYPRRHDACRAYDTAQCEVQVAAGTRADIAMRGVRPLVIEVVVTHDLEDYAARIYRDADIPVARYRPAWDSMGQLKRGVDFASVTSARSKSCQRCQDEDARLHHAGVEAARLREFLRNFMAAPTKRPTSWNLDSDGEPIYRSTQERLFREAVHLSRLGFLQSTTKPWRFCLPLPDFSGGIVCSLGSDGDGPIWRDPRPRAWFQSDRRRDRRFDGARSAVVCDYLIGVGFTLRRSYGDDLGQRATSSAP